MADSYVRPKYGVAVAWSCVCRGSGVTEKQEQIHQNKSMKKDD